MVLKHENSLKCINNRLKVNSYIFQLHPTLPFILLYIAKKILIIRLNFILCENFTKTIKKISLINQLSDY